MPIDSPINLVACPVDRVGVSLSDVRVFGANAFHRAKDVVHRLHWSGVVGAGGRRKHVSLPVCNIRAEYFNVDLIGSIRCSKASSSSPSLRDGQTYIGEWQL